MTYTSTILVESEDHSAVVRATREAFVSLGARELEAGAPPSRDTRIVAVSPARSGFVTVTDDTLFTADLAVAEHIAKALSTGAAVVGVRGGGSYGQAAARTFGTWKPKLPSSGKPNKLYATLDSIGVHHLAVTDAWEQLERAETKLVFDVSRAQLAPGPFKGDTPTALANVEKEAMTSLASSVMTEVRNNGLAAGLQLTRALRGLLAWQTAYDDVCNTLYCRVCPTEVDMATLALVIARRALDGLRSSSTKWEVEDTPEFWREMRWATAIAAAAVVAEQGEFDDWLRRVDDVNRAEIAEMLWDRYEEPLCELCTKARFDAVCAAFQPAKSQATWRSSGLSVASAEDAPGLARFGPPRAISTHEIELPSDGGDDGAAAIAFVGDRLCVARAKHVYGFDRGTSSTASVTVAFASRYSVMAIAEGPDGLLLAHEDKKLVAVDLDAPAKRTALGSTSDEAITFIQPSPDRTKIAIDGKVLEFGKPRALRTIDSDAHAWVDSERILRAQKQGAKVRFSLLSMNDHAKIGWMRIDDSSGFGTTLVVLGEHVYVGAKTGVYRVRWAEPAEGDAPIRAYIVWRGAAVNALALDEQARVLVAATDDGLVEIDASGAARTLLARPTTAVCVRANRIAALCDISTSRGEEAPMVRVFELTR